MGLSNHRSANNSQAPHPDPRTCARFLRANSGSFISAFALALPLILLAAWIAVNFAFLVNERAKVQAAADAAALSAAKQMTLSNVSVASIQQVAIAMASSDLPADPDSTAPDQITATVDTSQNSVTVSIARSVASLFADLITPASTISATATAQYKSAPICVLTLAGGGEAYNSKAASNLTANGCAIISNSTAGDGMAANTSGAVTSTKTCSAGGYSGNSFNPTPITDCPPIADPLAVRTPPPNASASCDHVDFAVSDTVIPLAPGVYCGGISVKHGPAVLSPGDYILRGGGLTINAGGSVQGADVGFYLTGGAVLNAKPNSALSLTAPSSMSDPMVGLVFWEDPNNMPAGQAATHTIDSDNGQNLHGTVYFPQGSLYIGGHANIGSASAYTIIVAQNLVTDQQANIVLNTNYTGSNIPVPTGVGNAGMTPGLSQ